MRNFKLHNIEITEKNNGVVGIQFYNVAGFEQTINVIAGFDLNGDDFDNRVFYTFDEDIVRMNNVDCDSYDNFCIHSIKDDDGELIYYDCLFDFVVDSVERYFKKSNKFISAVINKVIYENLRY